MLKGIKKMNNQQNRNVIVVSKKEKLKDSLRRIIDATSNAMLLSQNDGTIVLINKAAEKLFGISHLELVGQSVEILIPHRHRASHSSNIKKFVETPQTRAMGAERELFGLYKDGSEIPIEIGLTPLASGRNTFILATIIDISERIKNKRELEKQVKSRTAEVYFRDRAMEQASEGIIITNALLSGYPIIYVNPAFEKLSGYKSSELVGKSCRFLNENEHHQGATELIRKSLAEEQPIKTVIRNYRKDWNEITISPIVNDENVCTHFVCFHTDVTQRLNTEAELRLSEKVFESSGQAIMVTNPEREVIRINDSFQRISGYSKEDVILQPAKMIYSPNEKKNKHEEIEHELKKYNLWQGESIYQRKDGTEYPVLETISAVRDTSDKLTHYIYTFVDSSKQKEAEASIRQLAYYDPLTHLSNRALFLERFAGSIKRAKRQRKKAFLLFLDLDNFKQVNDSFGHPTGDQLLCEAANRLTSILRSEDIVSRLGGDEFVIVPEEIEDSSSINFILEKILETFHKPFKLETHQVTATVSIGVSCYPIDGEDTTTLIRNADTALYKAKAEGRNNYQFYSHDLTVSAKKRLILESKLRCAIDKQELSLVFQPKLRFSDLHPVGVEALVRWNDPEFGGVLPGTFIPIAEETGLIDKIGHWVLTESCRVFVQLLSDGMKLSYIAVNVSPKQLDGDFVSDLRAVLHDTGIKANQLQLEVTETAFMQNSERNINSLKKLQEMGVKLALDDFGTGYSSLNYLRTMPLDVLKIDRSFVKDLPSNSEAIAIAKVIVSLAKTLGMSVVAEGVETNKQSEFLKSIECDMVQGFLYSRPLTKEKLVKWLSIYNNS